MDDDEDEDQNQPTKYGFSVESKLDEDHLFYLQFTNNFISNVTRPRDFDHCTKWLERLAGEPMYGIAAKRNRNMFLAKLLIAMQDNKVIGPFSTFPPPGPLPNAGIIFGLRNTETEEGGDLMLNELDKEMNMQDYQYQSQDGRTYIATCALPNSSGVMAYIGLTIGGGEGLWINKEGYQVDNKPSVDRIQSVTSKTPVRKQIQLMEEHKEMVRKGLDNIWKDLPEEAFQFLIDLPVTSSDSNLLELGNYKLDKKTVDFLLEVYPQELIDKVQEFLVVSKKDIEKRLRLRHDKIVKQLYKEYSAEVERGLREYKEARQEWATVYQVVAELKEILDEKDAKDTEVHTQYASSKERPTKVLLSSLQDAKERLQKQYKIGKDLEDHKVELHKDIHERALFHIKELEKLEAIVDKLGAEICILRRDARKKQMVIDSLNQQLQFKKMKP